MPGMPRRHAPSVADTEEFPPLGGRSAGPPAAPPASAPPGMPRGAGAGGADRGGAPASATASPAASPATAAAAGEPSARPSTEQLQKNDPLCGYGMLGVLKIISRSSPDLNALALGYDLTSLGLSLNSPDYLYTNFCCPWRDEPTAVQPEFKLPQCYFMTPPHLRFQMFQRFEKPTLFYIFYSMPRDVLQLAAAQELYNRGWRYHKEHKLWLIRAPVSQPTMRSRLYERGNFVVWNPVLWKEETKTDFVLVYDQLEDRLQVAAPQQRPPASGSAAGGSQQSQPAGQQAQQSGAAASGAGAGRPPSA
eukprot:TRINITY_DN3722_c0_g1_i1.p2 TRINITY_DN3722_c0_g1~~TRINITY_DN3722_c0_g1_i1.p2  ORF type:complete len:306 (+),score=78.49 TRINITY_DN3722_c0_g1_i1:124-1041(+)